MPFCPKCRYEYVPGIVECPDCGIKLVAKLHEKPPEEPIPDDDFRLVTVGSFGNYLEAEMVQLRLESEGIESIIANDIVSRTGRLPVFALNTLRPYGVEVKVREEDAPRASAIIEEALRKENDGR